MLCALDNLNPIWMASRAPYLGKTKNWIALGCFVPTPAIGNYKALHRHNASGGYKCSLYTLYTVRRSPLKRRQYPRQRLVRPVTQLVLCLHNRVDLVGAFVDHRSP